MSLTSAELTNVIFQATVGFPVIQPAVEDLILKLPIDFENVTNLQQFNGTFTANNNMQYLLNPGTPFAQSPNFMIVLCDAQLNLVGDYASTVQFLACFPVNQFGFFTWIQNSSQYLERLYIEGRTGVPIPMPQNASVNYTVILGTANISATA